MNEKQKKEYLETSGCSCPYCGSKHITSEPIDAEGVSGHAKVTCETCGKTWKDIWTLTDVEEEG